MCPIKGDPSSCDARWQVNGLQFCGLIGGSVQGAGQGQCNNARVGSRIVYAWGTGYLFCDDGLVQIGSPYAVQHVTTSTAATSTAAAATAGVPTVPTPAACTLFFDDFSEAGAVPGGWVARSPAMTVEQAPDRGGVLAAHGCASSGNIYSSATFSCTTAAPCLISFMAWRGEGSSLWQGFSNQFSGDHSWVVTPGPFDLSRSSYSHSLYDATANIPANAWTLVQYTYPEQGHAGEHQWQMDGTTTDDFTGLRVMVQAAGPNCDTVRFDDFCVCGTAYDAGMTCVDRAGQPPPAPPPQSPSPLPSRQPSRQPSQPPSQSPSRPLSLSPSQQSPVPAPAVVPFLAASTTATPSAPGASAVCNGSPGAHREDCGAIDSSEDLCSAQGCCWSRLEPNPGNLPWCFRRVSEPACAVDLEVAGRVDCMAGAADVSAAACADLGCCWSPVEPNPDDTPWCFRAPTTAAPGAAQSPAVDSMTPSPAISTAGTSAPWSAVQPSNSQPTAVAPTAVRTDVPTAVSSNPDAPPAQSADADTAQNDDGGSDDPMMMVLLIVVAILAIALFVGLGAARRRRRTDGRTPPAKPRSAAVGVTGPHDTRINPAYDPRPLAAAPEDDVARGGNEGDGGRDGFCGDRASLGAPGSSGGYLHVQAVPHATPRFDGKGKLVAAAAGGRGSRHAYTAYGTPMGVGMLGTADTDTAAGAAEYATVPTAAMTHAAGVTAPGFGDYSEPLSADTGAATPGTIVYDVHHGSTQQPRQQQHGPSAAAAAASLYARPLKADLRPRRAQKAAGVGADTRERHGSDPFAAAAGGGDGGRHAYSMALGPDAAEQGTNCGAGQPASGTCTVGGAYAMALDGDSRGCVQINAPANAVTAPLPPPHTQHSRL